MIRTAMNRVIAIVLAGLALQGCADTSADPDRLRSFQVQILDTPDQQRVLRAVLVTLRDLGFVPESADAAQETASAPKWGIEGRGLEDDGVLRIRVSVRPEGSTRVLVRARMHYGYALHSRYDELVAQATVEDPRPYRQFFQALETTIAR